MGLFSTLKEKVSLPKELNDPKSYDDDMRNLDSLIEDLFKLDEKTKKSEQENKPKEVWFWMTLRNGEYNLVMMIQLSDIHALAATKRLYNGVNHTIGSAFITTVKFGSSASLNFH